MELALYPGKWPEADIVASPAEYAAMAERVAELAHVGAGEVMFPAAGHGLSAPAVSIGSGPVVAAIRGRTLLVSGGADAVELFGHNLPAENTLPAGYHVHYEHSTRDGHVAAESIPLVLIIGRGQGAQPSAGADRPRD